MIKVYDLLAPHCARARRYTAVGYYIRVKTKGGIRRELVRRPRWKCEHDD